MEDVSKRFRYRPILPGPAVEPIDLDEPPPRIEIEVSDTSGSGAHALLVAVYSNPDIPLGTRMRAAIAALPHEVPKLTASDKMKPGHGLGDRIESMRRRSTDSVRLIDGEASTESAEPASVVPILSPRGRP